MAKPKRDPDLTHERRQLHPGDALTVRDDTDASGPIGFQGHAAVFNKRTWIGPAGWGFAEEVAPGAFAKTITEQDVRFLVDHDPSLLLARNKAGTLRLAEDKVGLAVDADMAPTSYARDVAVLLERGDLSQMSFGFQVVRDKWEEKTGAEGNKFELRTLLEVKLFDVSVVTFPAYEDTDAGLRAVGVALLGRVALPDDARAQLVQALRSPADGENLTLAVEEARSALARPSLFLSLPTPASTPAPAAASPQTDAQPAPASPPTPAPPAAASGPTEPPADGEPAAPAPAEPTTAEPAPVGEGLLPLLLDHARGDHQVALRACPACGYDAPPAQAA